jgi:phage protein U
MTTFASGKHALAISDRSGLAFPYLEMVREWNGAWVHFSEFEPKQPQLQPKPTSADPQALQRARPARVALPTPSPLNNNPFLTEVGTTLTVTETNHGRSTGDAVRFYQVKNPVGGVAVSTFELSTTLATTITATDTSIVLTDGSEFPTSGYIVIESTNTDQSSLEYGKITSETIQYTGRSTNTLTGCTRGTAAPSYGTTPVSTTAAAHTAGAKIYGSYEITKIDETRINDAGSTETFSNKFSFTLVNGATSIETGGGFFVFGGPVNDRS